MYHEKEIFFGKINKPKNNKRLDKVLSEIIKKYSRSLIKLYILKGLVKINDKKILNPSKKIIGGESFFVEIPKLQDVMHMPQDIFLDVVYEDQNLMIINKQKNLVVYPGHGNLNGTMLNALIYHFPKIIKVPRAGIVHRLDKNTTGLIIVAKDKYTQNLLVNLIKKRKITRKYKGIVHGLCIDKGVINQPIARDKNNRIKMSVISTGKYAITYFQTLKRFRFHSLIRMSLETGRTHQIRVHMSYIDYPLVGDNIYKKNLNKFKISEKLQLELASFKRQALHAYLLKFKHPITGRQVMIKSKFPKDIEKLILALEYDQVIFKKIEF